MHRRPPVRLPVPRRAYVVLAVVAALIVSRWFRAGTFIATGDMGPWIRQGWAPEMSWSWNHSVTGAGSAAYNIGRALEFGLIELAHLLGSDEYAAQWVFYTLIYSLAAVGVGFLAAAFVKSEVAVVAAGTFAVLNGFFLTRLPNPLNIISVGTLALVTGVAVRVGQGKRIPPVLGALCLLPTSFLAFNPPMIVVAYAWALAGTPLLVALILGRRALGRLLAWFVPVGVWALVLNAWWLVPFAQSYLGGGGAAANATFQDPMNWSWAQINNSVPNVLTLVANWAWYLPQYMPFASSLDQPVWAWLRFLLPALAILAPAVALRARRRAALALVGLSLVVTFLAKGLVPPLTAVNYWMYLHVPMFWLFREPMSKLGQLLVLFFGVLIALVVEAAIARAPGYRPRHSRRPLLRLFGPTGVRTATAGTVLGVVAFPFPLLTGSVMPDVRPEQPSAHVRVPDYWWRLAERVDADPRPGKVLVLPLDDYYQMPTTWGFFGVDSIAGLLIRRPVVQRHPDGYFGDVPGFAADVQAVETALASGDLTPVPRLLDAIGVSQVVVRHDLIRGMPKRTIADDRVLAASIARVPGMVRVASGPLELWRTTTGSGAPVRTYAETLDAPSSPDGVAAAIGSTGTHRAMVAAEPTPEPTTPVVDHAPSQARDVITWPVPATDRGPATTTVRVQEAGDFRVSQRARAAAVLHPRLDREGRTLRLADPTRVLVDGVPASGRPDLAVPLPAGPRPVAVQAGSHTASLDTWGMSDTGPRSVPVGAATPLTVWMPSREPARPTPYSKVYDCNNYEPRPAAELGLGLRIRDGVVRLSAQDHAACTRVQVPDARPGRTYRIRLRYRSVAGKRPQICIWRTGLDGCELAARPSLGHRWTSYERFITVEPGGHGLQVVLHADVGQRLLGRTVTEYRDLSIVAVRAGLRRTIWPPQPRPGRVTLTAGTHTLRVLGGPSGSVLAPFEPLQDCFRYDDLTPEQAGLFARRTSPPGAPPAYLMGAREHMACVGATAPGFGAASLYELSYEARRVALRDPKVCLYRRGPDTCQTLPPGGPWDEWTPYGALVRPDPAAVETRVYLYGMRSLDGVGQAKVDYRQVRLRPVASPSTVVLVREQDVAGKPAPVTWDRSDPAHYTVRPGHGGPGSVVALAETQAPGWSLGSQGEHLAVQGWMNAWRVTSPGQSGTARYLPAETSRTMLLLTGPAVLAAVLALVTARWRRGVRERVVCAGRSRWRRRGEARRG